VPVSQKFDEAKGVGIPVVSMVASARLRLDPVLLLAW